MIIDMIDTIIKLLLVTNSRKTYVTFFFIDAVLF